MLAEKLLQTFGREGYLLFGSMVYSDRSELPIKVCVDYIDQVIILITIKGGKYQYITMARADFDAGPSEAWENLYGQLMQWRNTQPRAGGRA